MWLVLAGLAVIWLGVDAGRRALRTEAAVADVPFSAGAIVWTTMVSVPLLFAASLVI